MRDFQSLTLTCFHENSTQKQYLSHIRWNQLWRILQCSSSHYSTMIWRYTTYLNVCDKGTTSISSYGEYWHVYRCYQNVCYSLQTYKFWILCSMLQIQWDLRSHNTRLKIYVFHAKGQGLHMENKTNLDEHNWFHTISNVITLWAG